MNEGTESPNDREEFASDVIRTLENRIRMIETEREILKADKIKLERELEELVSKLERKTGMMKHFEQRIRTLETEKQIIKTDKTKLERELQTLHTELEQLRAPPLLAGSISDVLKDNRVIVKSTTGPHFVVQVSPSLPKESIIAGSRVALNQRSMSIVEILPPVMDPMVSGMEVEESPQVTYQDIGGLSDQIKEIREIVELPLLRPELFEQVGIEPPKGLLLYGSPGTGKTLLARAVAHETSALFIRVIGSELVQKYIGEGARLVREIFTFARDKSPSIVFIDELDAIGGKRLEIATSGDREVQRTLMQLLSAMDGFDPRGDVKLIAATNRPDILDPALLRPGRFDRIIEIPLPNKEAGITIYKIHASKMKLDSEIDFSRLMNASEGATGADIKNICTEAGMFAIRRIFARPEEKDESIRVTVDDFENAIEKVLGKSRDSARKVQFYA